MTDKKYWIGFSLVKGIGSVRMAGLLRHFTNLDLAWNAPSDALRSAGLSEKIIENLVRIRKSVDLDLMQSNIAAQGIDVITWGDEAYPRLLAEINQSPPILYVRGEIKPEDTWAVAIVGTRRVTSYGRQVTEEIAGGLARHGITIVSGLARGVDGLAHKIALENGGRTIAVLGSGVDKVYPPEHRLLAESIAAHGAVISDYPPGTPPDSINFPPRNRIISGLSLATVIIEAGETSGALITAEFAADQSRDVFAVPGGIYSPQSRGTNALIQQGARPYLGIDDLLTFLNLDRVENAKAVQASLPIDPTESKLYSILKDQPVHIDDIQELSGLPIEVVSANLTLMELKGMVRQTGNMSYQSIREPGGKYQ